MMDQPSGGLPALKEEDDWKRVTLAKLITRLNIWLVELAGREDLLVLMLLLLIRKITDVQGRDIHQGQSGHLDHHRVFL